jgi:hypothetical protein
MNMENKKSDIRTGFLRQRRNLFIISFGLLLFQIMGLRLDKISFFGNEFRVSRPAALSVCLWVAYLYYVVRYYQYFHDIKDRGVRNEYLQHVRRLLDSRVVAKAKRRFLEGRTKGKGTKYEFGQPEFGKNGVVQSWSAMIDVAAPVKITSEKSNGKSMSFTTTSDTMKSTETVFWKEFLRFRVQAFLSVCFRTSLVTDYYLPFVVACAPWLGWALGGKP